jgi:uncharacterized protein YoxC
MGIKENDDNFEYVLKLEKLETGSNDRLIIAGVCSSGDIDHDGERVDMDSLKSQFLKYMENPVIRFFHGKDGRNPDAIGKAIPEYTDPSGKTYKTEFTDSGPFIVAEISQAEDVASIRTKIVEKNLRGLSIGGRAKRVKVWDATLGKDVSNVIVSRWNETSVVDLPASKTSYFEVLKAACTGDNCPNNIELIEETDPIVDQAIAKFEAIINENTEMKDTLEKLESQIQGLERANDPGIVETGEGNENNDHISTINKAEVVEIGGKTMENEDGIVRLEVPELETMENEDGIVRLEVPELEEFIKSTVDNMAVEQETLEKLEDYDRLVRELKDMRAKIEGLEAAAKANAKALPEGKQMAMKSEGEVGDGEVIEKAAKKKEPEKEYDEDGNEIVDPADMKMKKLEAEIEELKSSPLYKAQQEEIKVEKTENTPAGGILSGVITAHYGGN